MENQNSQPNEQNDPNEQNKEKRELAKKLFFQANFTQAQIAQIVGVSQRTISTWMCNGKWKVLKHRAEQAPMVIVEQLTEELAEINAAIASRPPGQRFATPQEAEVRRKTLMSIKYVREQQSLGAHIEVLTNFTAFAARRDMNLAQRMTELADEFLKGQKKLAPKTDPIPYQLPDIDSYNQTDLPDAA